MGIKAKLKKEIIEQDITLRELKENNVEAYDKAIQYAKVHYKDCIINYDELTLLQSFIWSDSPEGIKYWDNILKQNQKP